MIYQILGGSILNVSILNEYYYLGEFRDGLIKMNSVTNTLTIHNIQVQGTVLVGTFLVTISTVLVKAELS